MTDEIKPKNVKALRIDELTEEDMQAILDAEIPSEAQPERNNNEKPV